MLPIHTLEMLIRRASKSNKCVSRTFKLYKTHTRLRFGPVETKLQEKQQTGLCRQPLKEVSVRTIRMFKRPQDGIEILQ